MAGKQENKTAKISRKEEKNEKKKHIAATQHP